jgi:hypothetical protein
LNIEEIVEIYYRVFSGIMPEEEIVETTKKTIAYLWDNGYDEKEIMQILIRCCVKGGINPNNLPDILWENSLLEKNAFYYHNILHITSKPPIWDPVTLTEKTEPYFMEMKIKFTMEDLLSYYYNKLLVPIELRDRKKDIGAFEHLLKKYKSMKVKPIDFVLTLIDTASLDEEIKVFNVLDLSKVEREVYDFYENTIPMAIYSKANVIVWR